MITYTMVPNEETYQVMAKIYMQESKEFKKRKRKLLSLCIVSLFLIALSVYGMFLDTTEIMWYAFLAIGIFTLIYGGWFYFAGAKRQILAAVRKANQSTEHLERTYTFGEEITIHTDQTDSRLTWSMIEQWGECDHYLYLKYSNSNILLDTAKMPEQDISRLKEKLKAEEIPNG
ncbi:MAG: YcxB family protein [Lachnospiraceae bacterium]|nr:YcxB family protein [Lachnospiraceae bacterium]